MPWLAMGDCLPGVALGGCRVTRQESPSRPTQIAQTRQEPRVPPNDVGCGRGGLSGQEEQLAKVRCGYQQNQRRRRKGATLRTGGSQGTPNSRSQTQERRRTTGKVAAEASGQRRKVESQGEARRRETTCQTKEARGEAESQGETGGRKATCQAKKERRE